MNQLTISAASSKSSQAIILSPLAAISALASSTLVPKRKAEGNALSYLISLLLLAAPVAKGDFLPHRSLKKTNKQTKTAKWFPREMTSRVTTQFWVALLIGRAGREISFNQSGAIGHLH